MRTYCLILSFLVGLLGIHEHPAAASPVHIFSAESTARRVPSRGKKAAERHLVLAKHFAIFENDTPAAIAETRRAIRADKTHLGALHFLAELLEQSGDIKGARATLKTLVRRAPKDIEPHLHLAELARRAGDWAGFEAALRTILKQAPKNAAAHHGLVTSLKRRMDAGDKRVTRDLKRHLKAFLASESKKKGPRFRRAARLMASMDGGDIAALIFDATDAFEAAWGAQSRRAISQRMNEARVLFQRCLKTDPTQQRCHYYLGRIFSSVKASAHYDLAAAKASFERAPDLPEAHIALARMARRSGDDSIATAAITRALAIDSDRQEIWFESGVIHKVAGRDKRAITAFARAVNIDRLSSLAADALGELTILDPEHRLVQATLRHGGVRGDLFDTEKFKSAVVAFEGRFGGVDASAPEQGVVEAVVERLIRSAEIDASVTFRVRVLKTPTVNAFAMPNGNIYVTQGFFDFLKKYFPNQTIDVDHEALAHVLAHELVHVLKEHLVRSNVFKSAAGDAGSALQPAVLTHLTRVHEIEADRRGMVLAFLAGYHPRGGISFLEAQGKEGEIPVHLDHPTYDERIHYLEEFWSNTVRYAWASFTYGNGALDEGTAAAFNDIPRAVKSFEEAVGHFKRFQQTLAPTKESLNNLGIAYAKLGVIRMAEQGSVLFKFATPFSVERDLAMRYISVAPKKLAIIRGGGPGAARPIPRELDQAVRMFKRALVKDPKYLRARENLALAYLARREVANASQALAALDGTPNAVSPNLRGVVHAALGEIPEAFAAFASAFGSDDAGSAQFNAAMLHQQEGAFAEARAQYEAIIASAAGSELATRARKQLAALPK